MSHPHGWRFLAVCMRLLPCLIGSHGTCYRARPFMHGASQAWVGQAWVGYWLCPEGKATQGQKVLRAEQVQSMRSRWSSM